jgi:hypothetical protein
MTPRPPPDRPAPAHRRNARPFPCPVSSTLDDISLLKESERVRSPSAEPNRLAPGRRLALLLVLGVPLALAGCDAWKRLWHKDVPCMIWENCKHYPCPPKGAPDCLFVSHDPTALGVCTCFFSRDGGPPPDFDPSHLPDPYHQNDAGQWVRDDDAGAP